ncbi:MAG: NAD(P)-dependent oxidoreductase [Erysipelotrichaceae bacterium]|nr:NAD(P)-dependent oxidoreductase [Erysipelotrichaceae bacterium]
MKKTVALTGASGIMGFQTFLELYKKKDEVDIALLMRDSEKNRKKFASYLNDSSVRIIWGNLLNYEDVLNLVNGADYVLHIGGMVSPKADYYPMTTLKTNIGAAQNIVKAVKAQKDPDAVKVVYIGTVAETGDRNPPIHWGRCGDPIKISVYDHYAISKVKAEAVFAESGLKHWVSLRQSGILYPDILKNMEPIMYHVPMNGVLEWATVEDSGRLMANICSMDLPDTFWRKFYNIGSGEEYRLTNYEFEELILTTLGLGSPKSLFCPNWFTTQNFHGQWYLDGDVLEELCHFRANIPVKEYFKEMMNHVEPFYKLAFLGRPYAPILKHTWMKSIAKTKTYGTLWWVQQNVEERMSAYYGSLEKYHQIPDNWNDFKLVVPSKKKESEEVLILNHGYDETKPFDELTLEDLKRAAAYRGGECLAEELVDMYTPVLWKSARGNTFMMSPNLVLKGGHWCHEELPWPWDYDTEAKINPFFAQVWTPLHDLNEMNVYGPEVFDDFKEAIK